MKCEVSGVDAAVMTTESPGHWRQQRNVHQVVHKELTLELTSAATTVL